MATSKPLLVDHEFWFHNYLAQRFETTFYAYVPGKEVAATLKKVDPEQYDKMYKEYLEIQVESGCLLKQGDKYYMPPTQK